MVSLCGDNKGIQCDVQQGPWIGFGPNPGRRESRSESPASSMARQPPQTDAMLLLPLDSVMVDSTRTCTTDAFSYLGWDQHLLQLDFCCGSTCGV